MTTAATIALTVSTYINDIEYQAVIADSRVDLSIDGVWAGTGALRLLDGSVVIDDGPALSSDEGISEQAYSAIEWAIARELFTVDYIVLPGFGDDVHAPLAERALIIRDEDDRTLAEHLLAVADAQPAVVYRAPLLADGEIDEEAEHAALSTRIIPQYHAAIAGRLAAEEAYASSGALCPSAPTYADFGAFLEEAEEHLEEEELGDAEADFGDAWRAAWGPLFLADCAGGGVSVTRRYVVSQGDEEWPDQVDYDLAIGARSHHGGVSVWPAEGRPAIDVSTPVDIWAAPWLAERLQGRHEVIVEFAALVGAAIAAFEAAAEAA